MPSEKELYELYASWPKERICAELKLNRREYTPDAAAVLEKVAAGKGVTSTEITKSPREIEQDEAQRKEKARNASRSTVVNICAAIALTFARAFQSVIHSQTTLIIYAAVLGAICGLIPLMKFKERDPKYAWVSFGVCTGCGIIYGLLLAIPAAITLYVYGKRRAKVTS